MNAAGLKALVGHDAADDALLARAARCGARAGVSRVADLTALDVLGVPVCQAVRPWSRALSVHQGKGLTLRSAQLGALMEGVESDAAEQHQGETYACAFNDLAPGERAAAVDDFGSSRASGLGGAEPFSWTPATSLLTGARIWVPWECVSLDLTFRGDPRLDRTSNGLAAGFAEDQALLAALCEVLERDAVAEWRALPASRRTLDTLDLDTLPDLDWLVALRAALAAGGMRLTLYALTSVTGWPVVVCLIEDPRAGDLPRGCVCGSACRPGAQDALQAAILEAAQTRLTAISATRDDILPGPARPAAGFALAPPLPSHLRPRDWRTVATGDERATAAMAAEDLAKAGYPQACVVRLLPAASEAVVVKAIVPGLGAYGRRRRAA